MTKRTASFSIAMTVLALTGAGCRHATDSTRTTSSPTSFAPAAAGPAMTAAAPGSTQIAGVNGAEYTVQGPILAKWESLDDKARHELGAPTGNEQTNPDGGSYQQFEGGVIVDKTQAYVVWGKIRDRWNELGGTQGKLGYPTGDEVDTADGAKQSTFQHGTITCKPGDAEATVTYS